MDITSPRVYIHNIQENEMLFAALLSFPIEWRPSHYYATHVSL